MLSVATYSRANQCPERVRGIKMLRALMILGAIFALSSCVPLEEGPEIVTVSVSPSTIEFNHYNGDMSVSILVAGFSGEIAEANAFIQLAPDDPRIADKDDFTVNGDTIDLVGITRAWFQGLPPGNYQIGATVISTTGAVIETLDLATVQVIQ